ADTCRAMRARLAANEGDCALAEQLSRQMIATATAKSVAPGAAELLAGALLARGSSLNAVHAALEQSWGDHPNPNHALIVARSEMRLAVAEGDFQSAERFSRQWWDALKEENGETPFEEYAKETMYLYLEMGRNESAARTSSTFLDKRDGLVQDTYFDYEIVGLRGLYLS